MSYFYCGACGGPAFMTAKTHDDKGRRLPRSDRRQYWRCPACHTSVTLRFDDVTRKVVLA